MLIQSDDELTTPSAETDANDTETRISEVSGGDAVPDAADAAETQGETSIVESGSETPGETAMDSGATIDPKPVKKRSAKKKTPDPEQADNAVPTENAAVVEAVIPQPKENQAPARKKNILDLNLNELDRDLTVEERKEWSAVYASYRSKSILTGTVVGVDSNTFNILNLETKEVDTTTLNSLIIIDYRVKILIPETEMWMPGTERPPHVLRNMVGSQLDYVVMEIDREGECAIGSRRMALAAKRHFFQNARNGHQEGERMKCRVVVTGAKRCTVEVGGYDIPLSQRELSYTAIADLREKYRPGQELDCLFKDYDKDADRLFVSVKEAKANPFVGAENRHPVGSRRHATISGKYAGGVFCTLPDDTVCLCFYSTQHSDLDFDTGDTVIVVIRQYDYGRQLIFGRILAKW